MIKKFGITIGGLHQKILSLVLVFILLIIGLFVAAYMYLSSNLSGIVEHSAEEQKQSIAQVSEDTMSSVLGISMTQSARMQAYMADNLFAEAKGNVLAMQEYAEYLYTHREEIPDQTVLPPDPRNDGTPTVQLQHEEGIDPADDPDLGPAANMGQIMLGMYRNSGVLNSCFIATAGGSIVYVDDRAGSYFDEGGNVTNFETRQRPWYTGAAETGGLYFTGIELDSFTNIPGLVCAAPVYENGRLAAVVGADIFLTNIAEYVNQSTRNGGFICLVDENGEILFSPRTEGSFRAVESDQAVSLFNSDNAELADFTRRALSGATELETVTVDGKEYYLCGAPMGTVGWAVISAVEKELSDQPTKAMLAAYDSISAEAVGEYRTGAARARQTLLILTLVVLVLATVGALTVAGRIVRPVECMTRRMGEIDGTDFVFHMEETYKTKDEIEVLAKAFAALSNRTRDYIDQITQITAEKERIGAELALATRIQADMLPNIFPPFPERSEFDIYATMTPAKEVGGDFYDFFLIDDDHLGMVMADVSGKGIPAALFMMMSKILVNNYAMMGGSPAQVLEQTNDQICKNNDEKMFVTVWFGVLEISTGHVTAANAGHEYPILRRADGEFELFKDKHGFVIGGMEGMRYKEYTFQIERGGTLFLYTDGVAEATNADNKMFGLDRMLAALNQNPDASPEELLHTMKQAVDAFAGDAPQFDDLTMLGLKLL